MGSFVKKIGREISKPFEQIGDFFVPDIDIEEGPTEEELTEQTSLIEADARSQARAQAAARRSRQQQFAGTSSLFGGAARSSAGGGLAGAVTGATAALRGQ